MKIILFTDTHANLPALQAFLHRVEQEGYDLLVHLGDAVAIGPQPAECLELLLGLDRCLFLMGNHDAWLAQGLPANHVDWMSAGEAAHQAWTRAQVADEMAAVVAGWPWQLTPDWEGVPVRLLHYALGAPPNLFQPIIKAPAVADLEALFAPLEHPYIFYGHHHPFSDLTGRSRFINPGSLGCSAEPAARYTVLTCRRGQAEVRHGAVPYDDSSLWPTFTARAVPERDFINQIFFSGRLH